jgi:hypothetical protein
LSETIRVRPWPDPIIDTLGHDPRSLYVETFWLPTLGPSTLLLLRRLAACFDEHPDGVELLVAETSQSLGLGFRQGRSSPLRRSLSRLVQFDMARPDGDAVGAHDAGEVSDLAVRRLVPPVNRRHVRRLPAHLQKAHEEWTRARLAEPPAEATRRNARWLALNLTQAGQDVDRVERALHAAGFHPGMCRETAAWAWDRHRPETVPVLAGAVA